MSSPTPIVAISPRPRVTYLTLAGAQDHGFECSGCLLEVRRAEREALRADDQEQPYVLRLFNEILHLPAPYRNRILPAFLIRECLDCEQRADGERALKEAELATLHKRAENGAVDRVLQDLRAENRIGKRPGGPESPEAA